MKLPKIPPGVTIHIEEGDRLRRLYTNEEVEDAVEFLTRCFMNRWVIDADELEFTLDFSVGSNCSASLIPHGGIFKDLDVMRNALDSASNAVFGTGSEAVAKARAWDAVRSKYAIPRLVGWDSACALAAPNAPGIVNPEVQLVAGFITCLVAPEIIFCRLDESTEEELRQEYLPGSPDLRQTIA